MSQDNAMYLLLLTIAVLRLLVPFRPMTLWKAVTWHWCLTVAIFSGALTHTASNAWAGGVAALVIAPFTWFAYSLMFEALGWKRSAR